jgi:ABC-2 type transport system ATP-binding protein
MRAPEHATEARPRAAGVLGYAAPSMPAALEISGVAKEFGATKAVVDVTLAVQAGEVLGLLGPNGAGKSTTLRMAAGLIRPSRGRVLIAGHDLVTDRLAALRCAGFLIEGPALPADLSARAALRYLALLDGGRERGSIDRRIDELLREVGLAEAAKKPVRHLSLGMKQRLGIAAALLERPRLLVLDEPMNGLDPAGIREVGDLLRRLGAAGVAVLLSSHLLDEVERVADRVAVMVEGKIAADVPVGAQGDHGALSRLFFSLTGAPAGGAA